MMSRKKTRESTQISLPTNSKAKNNFFIQVEKTTLIKKKNCNSSLAKTNLRKKSHWSTLKHTPKLLAIKNKDKT